MGQLKHNGPIAMREICPLKSALTDEELYDEINAVDKRQKILTGHLALDVRRLGEKEELTNRIDTMMLPVKPFNATDKDSSTVCLCVCCFSSLDFFPIIQFIREIHDFSNTKEYHLSYVNLVYVYPDTLKIKSSAANLMVEARLKAIDDPQAGGLRVWLGRSSTAKFLSAATTCGRVDNLIINY